MNRTQGPTISCWVGRIVAALVTLTLLADATSMIVFSPSLHAKFAEMGFADDAAPLLGAILVTCSILYAIPRTSMLGAIMLTAFLGGAVSAHFRLGEMGSAPQILSVVLGLLLWSALYLRNLHVRSLLPLTY